DGSLIKGGLFHGTGLADSVVGLIILIGAGVLIIGALVVIVKLMKSLMEAKAAQFLKKALEANAYAAMGIGMVVTIMVQSSSITTSTLVPLVGIGLISLEAIFPLTLGANIGTTVTALIASMASDSSTGLQIALCHLLFNILGILIWFPIPFMREVPLSMARKLGEVVAERRYMAVVYIAVVFFIIPFGILALDRFISGAS
ncbi:MAG: Na/Pi symporter, partial [Myxococcota bacterium]